jgi:hypothetical protein
MWKALMSCSYKLPKLAIQQPLHSGGVEDSIGCFQSKCQNPGINEMIALRHWYDIRFERTPARRQYWLDQMGLAKANIACRNWNGEYFQISLSSGGRYILIRKYNADLQIASGYVKWF